MADSQRLLVRNALVHLIMTELPTIGNSFVNGGEIGITDCREAPTHQ